MVQLGRTVGPLSQAIYGLPEDDKMRESPWYEFLTDPQTAELFQQGFPELYGEYGRIAEEGILSPADLAMATERYRGLLEPQVAEARARTAGDVSRRLGSRGRSGAAAAAMFNRVDVPAMRFVSDYANQLSQRNLASRQIGLQGQTGMLSGLMGAEAGLTDMEKQLYMFTEQLELQRKYLEEMSKFGFGDILELGARGLGAFDLGNIFGGKKESTPVSTAYPESVWG